MNKAFVSVGLHGRKMDEVAYDVKKATELVKDLGYEKIDNLDYVMQNVGMHDGRLDCLGEAIKKLEGCKIAFFPKDWHHYNGCIVEHIVCMQYGIQIIYY